MFYNYTHYLPLTPIKLKNYNTYPFIKVKIIRSYTHTNHPLEDTYKLYNQDYESNEQYQIFFNSTFPCYDKPICSYTHTHELQFFTYFQNNQVIRIQRKRFRKMTRIYEKAIVG